MDSDITFATADNSTRSKSASRASEPISSRRTKHIVLVVAGVLSLAVGIIYLICGITGIVRASVIDDEKFVTHFYYQAVTVVLGVILGICETVFVVSSINVMSSSIQPSVPKKLRSHPTNVSLRFGDQDFEEMKSVKLRKFTTSTALQLLLGVQLINGSLSAVMWGFSFVFSSYQLSGLLNVIPVVLSDVLLAIIAPSLASLAVIPLAHVIRVITVNQINPKRILGQIYDCIDYKVASDGTPYWVIVGTFYFLEESSNDRDHVSTSCCVCNRRKTTSVLLTIAILSFLLTAGIFVDDFLVVEYGPLTCRDISTQRLQSSVCFTFNPPGFVNCSENPAITSALVCFEFLSANTLHAQPLINAIIEAFVTFVLSNALISIIFKMIQFLLYIKRTKLWSILVIGAGICLFLLTVGLTIMTFFHFVNSFDFLIMYDLFIISLIIVLIGILLYTGEPFEAVSSYDVVTEDYPALHKSYRTSSL